VRACARKAREAVCRKAREAEYGKTHSNKSKQLMQAKKFGTILSDATKEKIIISRGHAVYLYKLNKNINITPLPSDFIFIQKFNSIRELGRFFKVSQSTISSYLKSGKIFKNCYKISSTSIL
jgi:group I intron endonuclease